MKRQWQKSVKVRRTIAQYVGHTINHAKRHPMTLRQAVKILAGFTWHSHREFSHNLFTLLKVVDQGERPTTPPPYAETSDDGEF